MLVFGGKMFEFNISTKNKYEIVDITERVRALIKDVKEGVAIVYAPHATAAIAINENYDPNVCNDLLEALDNAVPEGKWRHDRVDGNGAAHIKSAIIGPSEAIPVKDGKLMLGTWQSIMLCDFDGPRKRKVYVDVR